jgi:hypothetical protein
VDEDSSPAAFAPLDQSPSREPASRTASGAGLTGHRGTDREAASEEVDWSSLSIGVDAQCPLCLEPLREAEVLAGWTAADMYSAACIHCNVPFGPHLHARCAWRALRGAAPLVPANARRRSYLARAHVGEEFVEQRAVPSLLHPFVLRKELARMALESPADLQDPALFRQRFPVHFWNCVWYFTTADLVR